MLVEISHWVVGWSLIQSQIRYLIFFRLSSLFIAIIYLLYSSYICRTYMYPSVLGCSCLVWYCWWSTTWSVHSGYILSLGKLEGEQTWLCSLFLFFITPNNVKWHQFVKEYNRSSLLVQGFAEKVLQQGYCWLNQSYCESNSEEKLHFYPSDLSQLPH